MKKQVKSEQASNVNLLHGKFNHTKTRVVKPQITKMRMSYAPDYYSPFPAPYKKAITSIIHG